MIRLLIACVALFALALAPARAVAASDPDAAGGSSPIRVLVLTQSQGFVHDVVKPGKEGGASVVQQRFELLAATMDAQWLLAGTHEPGPRLELSFLDDASGLTDRLGDTDVLVFYTTGDLPLGEGGVEKLRAWVESGGGFVGIHPATDTLKGDADYIDLIGGRFDGHPWGSGDTVTIHVTDRDHPATAHLESEMTFKEEIYQFADFDRDSVRVLIELDQDKTAKKIKGERYVPIAWCKELGKGRVFYTSLGHRADVWTSPWFMPHVYGGIAWAAGRDATAPDDVVVLAMEPDALPGEPDSQPATTQPADETESANPNTLTDVEREAGWQLLFNGHDFTGWRGKGKDKQPGGGWAVDDGKMHHTKGGGDILTTDEFADFDLRFQWKVAEGANSGVFYRVSEQGEQNGAVEYQILDNKRHGDGKNPITSAAAAYAVYPPSEDVTRPAGEWNDGRIVARGKHVEHYLNGTKVLEYEVGSDDWNERVAKSKFKNTKGFAEAPSGHVRFQDHGNEVWYRDIKVLPLDPS